MASMYVAATYHSDHGEVPDPCKFYANEVITESQLPVLEADGYLHVGWYSTNTFDEGTELKVGDIFAQPISNLYAKWVDKVIVDVSSLQGIGDAIRATNGTDTKYKPSEMQAAILACGGGSSGDVGVCTVSGISSGHSNKRPYRSYREPVGSFANERASMK